MNRKIDCAELSIQNVSEKGGIRLDEHMTLLYILLIQLEIFNDFAGHSISTVFVNYNFTNLAYFKVTINF